MAAVLAGDRNLERAQNHSSDSGYCRRMPGGSGLALLAEACRWKYSHRIFPG
ncbi:hypothetical protein PGN35_002575 [Nodosilinea sp. PGN35]|uniref:hypothetical protein n=1 Tax=Nodosilinea sp. PGN35 TaxID=3020489 RepID=UPI0023B248EE|nr:hypothetical protein [Nodosilinea sp. TSF1-S3]MDF0365504.1 hypothetical protein [Nodosilinea sp. TSF1-S3]